MVVRVHLERLTHSSDGQSGGLINRVPEFNSPWVYLVSYYLSPKRRDGVTVSQEIANLSIGQTDVHVRIVVAPLIFILHIFPF